MARIMSAAKWKQDEVHRLEGAVRAVVAQTGSMASVSMRLLCLSSAERVLICRAPAAISWMAVAESVGTRTPYQCESRCVGTPRH
jgi:hypothetical protein